MRKTREWIIDFHDNVLGVCQECIDLIYQIISVDLEDNKWRDFILRDIRWLTGCFNEIDRKVDYDPNPAMECFRLAHLDRRLSPDIVEGGYASYHDLAFHESELLLLNLRSSDIVLVEGEGGREIPDDGPLIFLPEAISGIASSSLLAKLDKDALTAHLQLEAALAGARYGSDQTRILRMNRNTSLDTRPPLALSAAARKLE